MTDGELLREKIKNAGIKLTFVAESLGISKQALDRKLRDGADFKAYQMIILKDMLRLTNKEARDIFFAKNVDKNLQNRR